MESKDKELIRKSYRTLTDEIKNSVEDVTKHLWRLKIISKHMEEDVLEANNTKRKRAMALLDLLPTRGRYAFGALYQAVLEAELFAAADILKPEFAPHQVQTPRYEEVRNNTRAVRAQLEGMDVSSDEELPDSWPSEEVTNIKLRKIENNDVKQLRKFIKSQTPLGQQSYYSMKNKPRGRVLIVNQEKFDKMEIRPGTVRDRLCIDKLFQGLGFIVEALNDLTAAEMWTSLEKEAKYDHSNYDCFVLFILSHGRKGIVFGTDGECEEDKLPLNYIEIKNITDLFCSVKSLRRKPKLFFIQACQGSLKDPGFSVDDDVQSKPENIHEKQGISHCKKPASPCAADLMTSNLKKDTHLHDARETLKEAVLTEDSDAVGLKSPSHADVFVAMATTPDFVSWRNTIHGTWFIQAIVFIFSKYSYKYDLNKLMTMANQLVSKAATSKKEFKQIGEKKDTFQKTFYFFPGKSA